MKVSVQIFKNPFKKPIDFRTMEPEGLKC